MSSFVYDNTSLDFPKTDLISLPASKDPTKHVVASHWNTLCQAAVDIRSAILLGKYVGFTSQATFPGGATNHLWVRTSDKHLIFHKDDGTDSDLSAGGGSSGYTTIQYPPGTGLTARSAFSVAAPLQAVDNGAQARTDITHVTSGASAGTYKSVTVDVYGHVTAGTNPNAYDTIKQGGSSLTQRSVLNFSANFNATDNSGSTRTDVELATLGTAGTYTSVTTDAYGRVTAGTNPTLYYQTVKQAGSSLTQRTVLNFSANFNATDNSGSGRTDVEMSTVGTAGTYTSVTTDAYGRVTAGTNPTIYYQTVQANTSSQTQRGKLNFSANFALTDSAGSDRTTVELATTAVSANSYTLASITVDAYGRLTSAANGSVTLQSAYNTGATINLSSGTRPFLLVDDNDTSGDMFVMRGSTTAKARYFYVDGNGFGCRAPDATSGTTLQNALDATLRAKYWNGSATTDWDCVIRHVMSATTPTSKLSIMFNGTEKWNVSSAGLVTVVTGFVADNGGSNAAYIELAAGQSAGTSPGSRGRIRYNASSQKFEVSENSGSYAQMVGATSYTLSQIYANGASAPTTITLDTTRGGIQIKDASTPIAVDLFSVEHNSDGTMFAKVDTTGIWTLAKTASSNGDKNSAPLLTMRSHYNAGAGSLNTDWKLTATPTDTAGASTLTWASVTNAGTSTNRFQITSSGVHYFNNYLSGLGASDVPRLLLDGTNGVQMGISGTYYVFLKTDAHLNINTGIQFKRAAKGDVNYTLTVTDFLVSWNVTLTTTRTATLPTSVAGTTYIVKSENAVNATNFITVAVPSGKKLDGVTDGTKSLQTAYASVIVYGDGTDYFTLETNGTVV